MTKIINFKKNIDNIQMLKVSTCIRNGGLVIFPTETVYGIGANALLPESVDNIFLAKGRANDNPLIVHISSFEELNNLVYPPNEIEKKLMDAFMPGPITIILKRKKIIPKNVCANLDTVGIRMPNNKIAHDLIKMAGVPIAAPSANMSSKLSGTKIVDIKNEFKNKVDYIIDGGDTTIGVESTVVKVINDIPVILRPGAVTPNDIKSVIGIVKVDDHVLTNIGGVVESPGMKYKHYAPSAKTILMYSENAKLLIKNVSDKIVKKTIIIGSSKLNSIKCYKYLYYGDDLNTITHNIFTLLRKADSYKPDLIIIEGVKKEELGLAIMNRLIRAANFNYYEY